MPVNCLRSRHHRKNRRSKSPQTSARHSPAVAAPWSSSRPSHPGASRGRRLQPRPAGDLVPLNGRAVMAPAMGHICRRKRSCIGLVIDPFAPAALPPVRAQCRSQANQIQKYPWRRECGPRVRLSQTFGHPWADSYNLTIPHAGIGGISPVQRLNNLLGNDRQSNSEAPATVWMEEVTALSCSAI